MSAPSIVSFLQSRQQLSFQCLHPATYIETYHLHDGSLHTRTTRERLYSVTVVHTYDSPAPQADDHIEAELPQQHQHQQQQQQMTLHRSLTPPPPTSLPHKSASSLFSLAPLTSSPSGSHLSILCSTHPSRTVIRETYAEEPLASNMVGGWRAEGGEVSRLARRVAVDELLDVAPLAKVLWQLVLEYSGDIYEQTTAHRCQHETELCRWSSRHDIAPSQLMAAWMQSVCDDKARSLVEHSRYQRFEPSGAGWSHEQLIRLSTSPAPPPSSCVLHPVTPSTFLLTRKGVEAYHAYHSPDILQHYSYTRPPFQFPAVQGCIARVAVEVELPAGLLKREDGEAGEEEETRAAGGDGASPTASVASTAGNSSSEVDSPLSASSLSPLLSASPTPQRSAQPSISASSTTPADSLQLYAPFSPRRSSLPLYSSKAKTAPASTSSTAAVSSSPSSSPSLPTDIFFSPTWSVGSSLYRHSVKSLLSDWLGCDVPRGVCPPSWGGRCSRVEFAVAFMPNDQQPLPCFIMHK
jgi:hypothetical protein